MNDSTKNQAKGMGHEVKGKIKEETGDLLGKPGLEAKGKVEKNLGTVQRKVGEAQKDAGR